MPQNYGALEKVLRVGEGRRLKRLAQQADYVTSLEPDFEALSDEELAAKTVEFRQRLENGESLDELSFEAFAAVREAAKRSVGMRPFDVQVMGAIVLHEGDIAEMKTGEGKTLVATMPLYLNALPARGVHLVTVNDYLAKRDAEWMSPVYEALGMRASFIRNMMPFAERKEAYEADITYGTNSEFGFDYLRDNMAVDAGRHRPARPRLRDRGRGRLDPHRRGAHAAHHLGRARDRRQDVLRLRAHRARPRGRAAKFVPKGMVKSEDDADYEFDEKFKTVSPRETAIEKVERALRIENLYEPQHAQLVNHLIQALKAESLYQRDVDYVVQDGEVKIVDEFTGRIMEGRRWSEGLHQAVEAKEGVAIKEEHVTLATITLQNYFRLYEKLAGMTGTAKTEEKEFQEIYDLSVVEIPTNVDVARDDGNDHIYKTEGSEVQRRGRRHQGAPRGRAARPRRHDLRRGLRAPLEHARAPGDPAQRAEREAARARGRDHHGRRRARRGDHRDEHGRPRRRHQARARASARSAASTCSAPSATRRAGSTTSSAAAPAARATRASRASTSPRRTTSCASSPATGSTRSWSASSSPTTSRWRPRSSRSRSRTRRRRSRSRTSSRGRTSSSTTTS